MNTVIRPTIVLFALLSLLTGIVYPFAVTGLAQALFSDQAAGSLVLSDGHPVGSRLIGQSFSNPKYFWSRPSATAPQPYNAIASSGSNLGPLNPALTDAIKTRIDALRAADPTNTMAVPVDLVTTSASGLDPDISVAAANYQAARVARVRGLNPAAVQTLIETHTRGRLLGLIGEPRINVLELNMALDSLLRANAPAANAAPSIAPTARPATANYVPGVAPTTSPATANYVSGIAPTAPPAAANTAPAIAPTTPQAAALGNA